MGIEITRKKDGSPRSNWWYGRFTINGKSKCVNLGIKIEGRVPDTLRKIGDTKFERSRMRAQLKLEELQKEAMSQKAAEHHLKELYEIKAGGAFEQVPLTDMEEQWEMLPAKRKRSPAQVKIQKSNLREFRGFIQGNYPQVKDMSQVTRKMALAWVKDMKDRKLSGSSHNVKLAVVRGLFEQLGSDAGILNNPFAGIPYQALNTVHRKPFTKDELDALLKHCDPLIRPVVVVGMCTAMRRGDCCLLKWESVDLRNGFISVKTSKTGEYAEVPLFPLLREELENRERTSAYVFPEVAEMYQGNSDGISWRFKKALKNAEIKGTTATKEDSDRVFSVKDFHSLRTTWITIALTAGVPMELVRRVTGHSTVNIVLKHYFRPGREDFRHALESALPQTLTGETRKEKTPAEQLKELAGQVPRLKIEEIVERISKISEELAA